MLVWILTESGVVLLTLHIKIELWLEYYYPESLASSTPSDEVLSLSLRSHSDVSYSPDLISPAASLPLSRVPTDHRKHRVRHSSVPCHSLQPKSQLRKFLRTPSPPAKLQSQNTKSCRRVLTSYENMKIMEAKEREKEEKARMKLERQNKRQQKRQAKEL